MARSYTEQDTERRLQAERSSEGIDTQRLPPLTQPMALRTPPPADRLRLLGWLLLALGALLFFVNLTGAAIDVVPGVVLLSIASGLLFFSFWQRIYGLLIPGCILIGLSIGVPFADLTNGASVLWGLALGFLGILFVGRALFGVRTSWPVFPAVPLFLVGVIVAASTLPTLFAGGLIWLPAALVALGLFLGWRRSSR
jgi:hypothetical protein